MATSLAEFSRMSNVWNQLSNGHRGDSAEAAMAMAPEKVDEIYEGPQGALLALASRLSGNTGAADRLLRQRLFDLSGLRNVLDVGSGAGQLAAPLLRYADPQATLTCSDRSLAMLLRSRARLDRKRLRFVAADITCLPFADHTFDGVTCGYVLEHLPDPRAGISELARVLSPGGRLLLMAIEDNLFGRATGHAWCCQALNRQQLREWCERAGLGRWREIQVPRWHQLPWIDGICVELIKPRHQPSWHFRNSRLRVGAASVNKEINHASD